MTIFERLNPFIQEQVVASIDGLFVEEKKLTSMVLGHLWKKFMNIGY
jgi:hypothetical protein